MRQTLTTQEVALWLRINPGSVARWDRDQWRFLGAVLRDTRHGGAA